MTEDTFDTQQRRRLWHALRVLDLHVAIDHASDPLILPGTYAVEQPMDVNDSDLWPGITTLPHSSESFTDTTFSLMTHEITATAIKAHSMNSDGWQERQAVIRNLEQVLNDRYFCCCNPNQPLQWFALAVGKSSIATLLLHTVRPTKASSTKSDLSGNSEYLLRLAVDALEAQQACLSNSKALGWQWSIWPQWHALAVALAVLSFITNGDLAERAWALVTTALDSFKLHHSSIHGGRLQAPIEKLAQNALKARAASMLQETTFNNNSDTSIYSNAQANMPEMSIEPSLSGYDVDDLLDWEQLMDLCTNPIDTELLGL